MTGAGDPSGANAVWEGARAQGLREKGEAAAAAAEAAGAAVYGGTGEGDGDDGSEAEVGYGSRATAGVVGPICGADEAYVAGAAGDDAAVGGGEVVVNG